MGVTERKTFLTSLAVRVNYSENAYSLQKIRKEAYRFSSLLKNAKGNNRYIYSNCFLMGLLVLLPLALVAIIVSSHFLSLSLYKKLVSNGDKNAMAMRIIVFILSVAILILLFFLLVVNNLRFER
jgi:uncharacterized BrkB/YihY/UPF0761 family membrane protein